MFRIFFLALFALTYNAWGAFTGCYEETTKYGSITRFYGNFDGEGDCVSLCYEEECPSSPRTVKYVNGVSEYVYLTGGNVDETQFGSCYTGQSCNNYCSSNPQYGCSRRSFSCVYTGYCSTLAEADSVNQEQHCTGGQTVGCQTFPSGNLASGSPAYIHRVYILDSCTQTQQLVEEAPGSCAEVGYCNYGQNQCTDYGMGGYLEGNSSSSSPGWSSSSGVECRNIGLIGNTCYYECNNGAKGYCDGKDGQCDNVENCSWDVPPQSSESGEGGEGGASSSSPGDSSATSSPSAIDYTEKLNEIIDSIHNTNDAQRAGNAALIGIDDKINQANKNLAHINNSVQSLGGKLDAVADASADAAAQVSDTLHNTNSLLDMILSFFLGDSVEYDDDKSYLDSTLSWAEGLQDRFSSGTEVPLDSLKADTSQFRSKFSKMFISNSTTREGCYIFTMKGQKKGTETGFFFDDVVVNFAQIGGFNLCAIIRGCVKFCAFILCLFITISSYRSAFASTTND